MYLRSSIYHSLGMTINSSSASSFTVVLTLLAPGLALSCRHWSFMAPGFTELTCKVTSSTLSNWQNHRFWPVRKGPRNGRYILEL